MDTKHIEKNSSPLCGAPAAGALVVELAVHADCQLCLRIVTTECVDLHRMIKAGAPLALSIGIQADPEGDLRLYDCPRCGSTIARRV